MQSIGVAYVRATHSGDDLVLTPTDCGSGDTIAVSMSASGSSGAGSAGSCVGVACAYF